MRMHVEITEPHCDSSSPPSQSSNPSHNQMEDMHVPFAHGAMTPGHSVSGINYFEAWNSTKRNNFIYRVPENSI